MGLSLVLLVSAVSIFVSFGLKNPFTDDKNGIVYTGFSLETFSGNLYPSINQQPDTVDKQSFNTIFGVLFPACSGILAGRERINKSCLECCSHFWLGASMSGNLKSPATSIPKGTLGAAASTMVVYILITLALGATTTRNSLRLDWNVLEHVRRDSFAFGFSILLPWLTYIKQISIYAPLITAGILAASIYAVLSSIITSAKILQALARSVYMKTSN